MPADFGLNDTVANGLPTGQPPSAGFGESDAFADPHMLGQQAAQGAGVKPVAAPPPIRINPNANRGFPSSAAPVAAPTVAPNEEATFAPSDTAPGDAAPQAADRFRNGFGTNDKADIDVIKSAQNALVAQKIAAVRSQLPNGADFDPSIGDSSVYDRARMGLMANSTDRAKYMQDNLPPGSDVRQINVKGVGPMVVFKPPGATAYRPIKGTTDIAGPIGDALGAVPSVAAQVGTAYATDGAGLLSRLFSQAAVGAGERAAELGVNKYQGYDSQPLSADARDVAGAGAAASAGELAGSAVGFGKNALTGKGKGLFDGGAIADERRTADNALQAYLPDSQGTLTPFQMGHPLLESKGQRLAAVNPTIANRGVDQQNYATALFQKSMADANGGAAPAIGDAPIQIGNVLYPGLKEMLANADTAAKAPLAHVPDTELAQGGTALSNIYQNAIKPLVDRTGAKYDKVIDAMNNAPQFENGVAPIDLSATHARIDDLAAPKYGQGNPVTTTTETPVMAPYAGYGTPAQIGTKTETTIAPGEVKVGGGIMPGISNPVGALRNLKPDNGIGPMSDRTLSPYEAIQPVRSALSEASVYSPLAPGADRATAGQAQQILKPLDEAIDTAAGPAGTSAKLSKTFQTAMLDNDQALKVRNTTTPEANMNMANPKNSTFIKNTGRLANATGQSGEFDTFRNALLTQFKRNPDAIDGFMKSAAENPGSAGRILGGDADNVSQYAANNKALQNSPLTKIQPMDYGSRANYAVNNFESKDLAQLVNDGGGKDSAVGQNLRAALFKNIYDNGIDDAGKAHIGKIQANINDAIQSGKADTLLNPDEVNRLKAIQQWAEGAGPISGGTGSSFFASTTADKAFPSVFALAHPLHFIKGQLELLEARVQSSIYTGDHGKAYLMGDGKTAGALPRASGTAGAEYELNQKRQETNIGN